MKAETVRESNVSESSAKPVNDMGTRKRGREKAARDGRNSRARRGL